MQLRFYAFVMTDGQVRNNLYGQSPSVQCLVLWFEGQGMLFLIEDVMLPKLYGVCLLFATAESALACRSVSSLQLS